MPNKLLVKQNEAYLCRMSPQGKKLALLVSAAPGQPGFRHGAGLAQAALAAGIDVYFYCIDDAVTGVADPLLEALAPAGLKLFACAESAQRRRLPMNPRATYAGLALLANLIAATDRFVAFT
jgi:sulfur relay (sulfurtransferase) complex TusBCD TusD component (DsrE family)